MTHADRPELPDFAALFAACPNPYLVLAPDFTIVAVNDSYCRATMTRREDILGRGLFDVFPDNPDDLDSMGTSNLHNSLVRVIEHKRPDAMAVQKYDIRKPAAEGGAFEVRYWSPLNVPVPGPDGELRWIIHYVEDVTELMLKRYADSEREEFAREQQKLIDQLRRANRELADRIAAGG